MTVLFQECKALLLQDPESGLDEKSRRTEIHNMLKTSFHGHLVTDTVLGESPGVRVFLRVDAAKVQKSAFCILSFVPYSSDCFGFWGVTNIHSQLRLVKLFRLHFAHEKLVRLDELVMSLPV